MDAPPLTEVVAHAEKSEVSEDEASECVQGSFMIYVFMPGAELAGRLYIAGMLDLFSEEVRKEPRSKVLMCAEGERDLFDLK